MTEPTNEEHINSERERISIERRQLRGKDVLLLVIWDDAPPHGTGVPAPMLLDESTQAWLLEKLKALAAVAGGKERE